MVSVQVVSQHSIMGKIISYAAQHSKNIFIERDSDCYNYFLI